MKTAYKKAIDQITVSDQMRERILASAAKPRPRYGWVKPVCGAAACFALLCTVGLAGLQGIGNSKLALPETAMKFDAADESSTTACAPAEVFDSVTEDSADEDFGGNLTAKGNSPAAEDAVPETLIGNPLVTYAHLEDALEVLDFVPVVPAEAVNGDVTVIAGEILQLCWQENGVDYTYRTAPGDGDVSGVYIEWKSTEETDIAGQTVSLMGDGNTVSLALWEDDGMAFSLWAEPGTAKENFENIIG